jgi:hypothetical protein
MNKVKFILVVLIVIIYTGCASNATFLASKIYMGMPINDFIALSNGKAKLESVKEDLTIYVAYDKGEYGIKDKKFFYFSNGKLIKMDGGVPQQTRQQIEIIKK